MGILNKTAEKEAGQPNGNKEHLPDVDPEKAQRLAKREAEVRERMREGAAALAQQASSQKDPFDRLKVLADGNSNHDPLMHAGNPLNQPAGNNTDNMMHTGSLQNNPLSDAAMELPPLPTMMPEQAGDRNMDEIRQKMLDMDGLKRWSKANAKNMEKPENAPFAASPDNNRN